MGEVGNIAIEDPKMNGEVNGTHDEVEPMEVDNNDLLPDPAELKKNLCTDSPKDSSDTNGKNNEETPEPEISEKGGDEEEEISEKGAVEESEKGEENSEAEPEAENENGTDENSQDIEAMEVDGKNVESQDLVSNEESAQGVESAEKDPIETEDKSNKIEEAVVLSDTDDEDEDSTSSSSKLKSGTQSSAVSDSENDIANSSTNPSRMEEEFDEDKPVSIHSDSDEEEISQNKTTNTNGAKSSAESSDKDNDDCIVIDDDDKKDDEEKTPDKKSTEEKEGEEISPRRSSRQRKPVLNLSKPDYDDDIEEIIEDPLDCSQQSKRMKLGNTSIDLSMKSKQQMDTKSKEPSLVIIDTESIIQKRSVGQTSVYPVNSQNSGNMSGRGSTGNTVLNPFAQQTATSNLLPNLTDDMFVLEAPSFIVPYIYEKPPPKDLKEAVTKLGSVIEEEKRKEKERKLREEGDDSDENESDTAADSSVKREEEDSSPQPVEKEEEKKKKKSRRRNQNGDESWDEYDTSTDDEASDSEKRTKVLIKEADIDDIKTHVISADTLGLDKKSDGYFDSPLGKFFMTIGVNLVQEYVQSDLLRQQRRKREREGKEPSQSTQIAINSLMKNLEMSKENNAPFKHKLKRCEFCPFKTESQLALSQHYETPHLRGNIYKCNFCEYETRPAHEILYHMEAIHNLKGKLEKPLSYHQCPNCPFEDNGKSKLARHEVACAKKYKPEINLNPPLDWEPPAKIPKIKAKHGLVGAATAYQAMAAQQQQRLAQAAAVAANVNKLNSNAAAIAAANAMRNRGRPQTVTKASPAGTILRNNQFKPNLNSGMILPNNYQLAAATLAANSQFLQQAQKLALLSNTNTTAYLGNMANNKAKSGGSTPSISITPLPRQQAQAGIKPGQNPNASNKAQFVICEICDGYIKDLDQLRNHMQWIHKVKIHPKMIYNRPPLNCQKCQFRFFTDQGLERHLLGSHGLVTSSMQEAANKGKDAGRCPVCGKVYQWKLLNHVSRDHSMTLKPAHLSYKCTVCTATFGMYKQFESHVYSAHSTVAKKDGKNKAGSSSSTAGTSGNSQGSLLKPLKINDEITIIPQPTNKSRNSGRINEIESHVID